MLSFTGRGEGEKLGEEHTFNFRQVDSEVPLGQLNEGEGQVQRPGCYQKSGEGQLKPQKWGEGWWWDELGDWH